LSNSGISNTGGTIQALHGSEVRLASATGISGGTLTTVGSGVIRVVDTDFNNVIANLNQTGRLEITNGSTLRLLDGINNTGSILVNSTGAMTELRVSNNVTLSGGGTITLAGEDARFFDDQPGTPILTVANQTIEGRGVMYGIGIINQANGLFHANSSGNTLTLSPDSFSNSGTLRASNSGTLVLNANSIGGALIDVQAGSLIDINGATTSDWIRGGGMLMADGSIGAANLAPGDSVGTLTLVTQNFGAGIAIGNLEIELASATSYDLLNLSMNSGSSSIDGLLSVDLLGNYLPDGSDVFTVLTGLSALGFQQFSNTTNGGLLWTVGGEGTFEVTYANGEVLLSNFTAAIPEPTMGALIVIAGALAFSLRRQRQ
jgi:hypothetical protein